MYLASHYFNSLSNNEEIESQIFNYKMTKSLDITFT